MAAPVNICIEQTPSLIHNGRNTRGFESSSDEVSGLGGYFQFPKVACTVLTLRKYWTQQFNRKKRMDTHDKRVDSYGPKSSTVRATLGTAPDNYQLLLGQIKQVPKAVENTGEW